MRLKLLAFCAGIFWLQQQPALPDAAWLWALPLILAPFWLPPFERTWPQRAGRLAVLAACLALGRMTRRLVRGEGRDACREEAQALVRAQPKFRFDPWPGRARATWWTRCRRCCTTASPASPWRSAW